MFSFSHSDFNIEEISPSVNACTLFFSNRWKYGIVKKDDKYKGEEKYVLCTRWNNRMWIL